MTYEISNKSARTAYCGLFVASLFVSWILAEFAATSLLNFPWINDGKHTKEWYQINAILRVSLGNFVFFTMLALTMIGVKSECDQRYSWHHGKWIVKMTIWFLLIILMFLMPNEVVRIYGFLSKFGAGLLLLLQFVVLLDSTSKLHDACFELDDPKWTMAYYAAAIGCFIAALALYILLFSWFAHGQDCFDNVMYIGISLALALALALTVMINEVALLSATVTLLYCAYVCYTGLSTEPNDNVCGAHNKAKHVSISSLILEITSTILTLLYTARRAGSIKPFLSSSAELTQRIISFGKIFPPDAPDFYMTIDELEKTLYLQPVSYSYTFFHLIFVISSMYSVTLLSRLGSLSDSSDLIDVSWTSALIKIGAGWMTIFVYILILTFRSLSRPWPYSLIQTLY